MIPLKRSDLLARGFCCGSGCRNCPYVPRHTVGSTAIEDSFGESE